MGKFEPAKAVPIPDQMRQLAKSTRDEAFEVQDVLGPEAPLSRKLLDLARRLEDIASKMEADNGDEASTVLQPEKEV